MRVTTRINVPVWWLITVLMTAPLCAAEESASELAKKTQNPVADLISVPFQNNFNLSAGPNDATIYVLNVQPVIPLKLTEDWNLITRTIMPIINQPSLFPGDDSAFGLGDLNPKFFLSPAKPGTYAVAVLLRAVKRTGTHQSARSRTARRATAVAWSACSSRCSS